MSTNLFLKCISEGKYDTVKPGTVCTIDQAKKNNIFDTNTIVPTDLKIDTYTSNKILPNKLCTMDQSGVQAYANCPLQNGNGFVRDPNNPSQCVTTECPPGFSDEGGTCTKPEGELANIEKKTVCNPKWYEWFITPNYHLGNRPRFDKGEKTCYGNCPPDMVPGYIVDPVDNEDLDTDVNTINKCILKNEYFSGKYADSSDYCPLSWIHRLTLSETSIQQKVNEEKRRLLSTNNYNLQKDFQATYQDNIDTLTKLANTIQTDPKIIESLTKSNDTTAIACQRLNKENHLTEAYAQCKKLEESDKPFYELYTQDYKNTPQLANQKINMLKQSCDAVFCDPNYDAAAIINQEPICFPNTLPPSKIQKGGKTEPTITKDKADYTNDKQSSSLLRILQIFIIIIIIPFVILILFYVIQFIYKYIILPVYDYLTGKIRVGESENVAALRKIVKAQQS
jgi:hypothetical protein